MSDENLKDQLVTVPKLARLLAKDPSFVDEIGLGNLSPDEIVYGLELIVGFVLAMYNTAKTIFSTHKTLSLYEKFTQLIYSRFVLMTEKFQNEREALNYAFECYDEIERNADQSGCKWDDMPLGRKFAEVCVSVLIEERKLWEPNIRLPLSDIDKAGCREVLAVAFKGVFDYVKWELDDEVWVTEKVVLEPKKAPGPDSRLKDYPLLYLYFDSFAEINRLWKKGHFQAARHDSDIRSCRFSLAQIMNDENLFLNLYEKNLLRLRLNDETHITKREEEFYWDEVRHPGKLLSRFPFPHNTNVPDLAERQESYRKNMARISEMVEAIKSRYGLTNSDKT